MLNGTGYVLRFGQPGNSGRKLRKVFAKGPRQRHYAMSKKGNIELALFVHIHVCNIYICTYE